jgi:hypothetical protein
MSSALLRHLQFNATEPFQPVKYTNAGQNDSHDRHLSSTVADLAHAVDDPVRQTPEVPGGRTQRFKRGMALVVQLLHQGARCLPCCSRRAVLRRTLAGRTRRGGAPRPVSRLAV